MGLNSKSEYLTHMHRVQVMPTLHLNGGDKHAANKTAFAGTSFARLLVLLQKRANHLLFTLGALHSSVVHVTSDEAALGSGERLLTAEWTECEVCDAQYIEHTIAYDAIARPRTKIAVRCKMWI